LSILDKSPVLVRLLIALAVLIAALLVLRPWAGDDGADPGLSKMEILRQAETAMVARGLSPTTAGCIADGASREFSEEELQSAGDAFGASTPASAAEASPLQLAVIAQVTQIGIACSASP
jgi:hypothetical protein